MHKAGVQTKELRRERRSTKAGPPMRRFVIAMCISIVAITVSIAAPIHGAATGGKPWVPVRITANHNSQSDTNQVSLMAFHRYVDLWTPKSLTKTIGSAVTVPAPVVSGTPPAPGAAPVAPVAPPSPLPPPPATPTPVPAAIPPTPAAPVSPPSPATPAIPASTTPTALGITQTQIAAWDKVNICEESGTWTVNGAVYSGGLGFSNVNWSQINTFGFPADAAQATPDEQIRVAVAFAEQYFGTANAAPDQAGCGNGY